jgi:hypothetical protein
MGDLIVGGPKCLKCGSPISGNDALICTNGCDMAAGEIEVAYNKYDATLHFAGRVDEIIRVNGAPTIEAVETATED